MEPMKDPFCGDFKYWSAVPGMKSSGFYGKASFDKLAFSPRCVACL